MTGDKNKYTTFGKIAYQWEVYTIVTNAKLHLRKIKNVFIPLEEEELFSFAFLMILTILLLF